MTDPHRPLLFWLTVGAVGFLVVPWYALGDSVFAFGWVSRIADKEAAPALLQVLAHGKAWLAVPGLLIAAGAALLRPGLARNVRANALIAIGAAGFVDCFAQGFAIGPAGWSYAWLGAILPPLSGGQYGMGLGALLAITSFGVLFALGLAGRGYFKGDPFVAASVVGVAALIVVFTFFPVFRILVSALQDGDGAFSLAALPDRLFREKIWGLGCVTASTRCGVAWNTLLLAFLCATGCTAFGLAFALIATRTGFRQKKLLRVLTVLPIITPPFVIGLGLILIFGRSGLVNQLLDWAFGLQLGRWIYGLHGVLLAQVFAFTPIAFLVLIGVVEGVSPSLEEAAQTLRADRWRVFADVSLPLMRPGLANAFLISFIESIADFGNPILLGGNFGVLSTEIFFSVVGAQLDQGRAATLGILLLGFALGAFYLQRWALGRKVYTSLTGKGDAGLPTELPAADPPSVLLHRAAVGAAHRRDLRDGAHRRLRRDLGARLHAHAAALREGVRHRMDGARRAVGRRRVELVLDHGQAVGDRRADHCRHRHPGRLRAHAAEVRRAQRVRVRNDAVVRDPRHRDRRVVHPHLQRAADRDHRHRADPRRLQRLPQHAGRRPGGHRGDEPDRPEPRRGVDDAGRAGSRRCARILLPLLKPAVVAALVYSFVRAMTTLSAVIFLVSAEYEWATTYIINRVINGDYGVAIAYSSVLIVLMLAVIAAIQWLVGTRRLGRRGAAVHAGVGEFGGSAA